MLGSQLKKLIIAITCSSRVRIDRTFLHLVLLYKRIHQYKNNFGFVNPQYCSRKLLRLVNNF